MIKLEVSIEEIKKQLDDEDYVVITKEKLSDIQSDDSVIDEFLTRPSITRKYPHVYETTEDVLNDATDDEIIFEYESRGLFDDDDSIGDYLKVEDIDLALKLIGEVKLGGDEWLLTEKLRDIRKVL